MTELDVVTTRIRYGVNVALDNKVIQYTLDFENFVFSRAGKGNVATLSVFPKVERFADKVVVTAHSSI